MRGWMLAVLLFLAPVAHAQEADEEGCVPETFDIMATGLSAAPTAAPGAGGERTPAERRVQEVVSQEGVHVVHFWAPWCVNSIAELREGWYALVEDNPDVTFTFVTVWNDGAAGAETLDRFAIPDRVLELTQPDFGPSDDPSQRRRTFLDLPLTWIPSTWIFHDGGTLAFALNYGEMQMETLQHLVDAAAKDW